VRRRRFQTAQLRATSVKRPTAWLVVIQMRCHHLIPTQLNFWNFSAGLVGLTNDGQSTLVDCALSAQFTSLCASLLLVGLSSEVLTLRTALPVAAGAVANHAAPTSVIPVVPGGLIGLHQAVLHLLSSLYRSQMRSLAPLINMIGLRLIGIHMLCMVHLWNVLRSFRTVLVLMNAGICLFTSFTYSKFSPIRPIYPSDSKGC